MNIRPNIRTWDTFHARDMIVQLELCGLGTIRMAGEAR
jgi:hypothetical protein